MQNKSVQAGLILAAVNVIMFLLMTVLDLGMWTSVIFSFLGLLISVILLVVFVKRHRSEQGDYLTFGQAFVFMFIAWAVAGIISMLFTSLYIHVIDPGYVSEIINKSLEGTYRMMEGNIPDEQINETLDTMEKNMQEQFTFVGQLKGLLYNLIIGAVVSAIIAAFVKKTDGIPEPGATFES